MTEKIFGSSVDWISQHSVFPEYFRQQFYDTGNIFPEFAAQIGGGQNIYHFAYYGLYNPLYLPAYVLPFVKMSDYIMFVSILCLAVDGLLFFKWIRSQGISNGNSILTSVLFLLAGPMVFHSYTHLMFVNYMPFLLLALIGTDRYFQKNKSDLLTAGVFLMILTSFYFSIGGLLVLLIYGVFRYLDTQEKQEKKTAMKSFFLAGCLFCISILSAVMMSSFLLVPTAVALKNNARVNGESVSFPELFLPNSDYKQILYHPYGIGLTTLVVTVLITGVTYEKWKEKYIHMVCFLVLMLPVFQYVLNGGLYIRGKVLIPILPLLCWLIAMYLEKQRKGEIPFWKGILPFILTVIILWGGEKPGQITQMKWIYLADAGIMLLCGLIFYRKHKEKIFLVGSIGMLLISGILTNGCFNQMTEKAFYDQVTDKNYRQLIQKVQEKEKGFYRIEQAGTKKMDAANLNRIWSQEQYSSSIYSSTYNKEYQKFRKDLFQIDQPYRNKFMQARAKNPIFQKLMGVKYLVSEQDIPGYEKLTETLYENPDVYPVVYATNQYLSEQDYKTLKFPYNQTAFLDFAVVKNRKSQAGWKEKLQSDIQKIDMEVEPKKIDLKQSVTKNVSIPQAKEGDLLLLQFDVANKKMSKDIFIDVEGIRNKLTEKNHIYYNENETFTYVVVLEEGQTQIQIKFGAGTYVIKNLKSYIWKNHARGSKYQTLCQSHLIFDKKATKGNRISGKLKREEAGMLITSIPFDKNFNIYVDGEKIISERVNTSFLGGKVENGIHDIEIIYHAPGMKTGKVISILGLFLYVFHRKVQKKLWKSKVSKEIM